MRIASPLLAASMRAAAVPAAPAPVDDSAGQRIPLRTTKCYSSITFVQLSTTIHHGHGSVHRGDGARPLKSRPAVSIFFDASSPPSAGFSAGCPSIAATVLHCRTDHPHQALSHLAHSRTPHETDDNKPACSRDHARFLPCNLYRRIRVSSRHAPDPGQSAGRAADARDGKLRRKLN